VIAVGMLSHRFGWDPDNLVVPVLTTAGDTFGIVFLLLAGEMVGL
jgi:mgtE-like transporter